MTIFDAIKRFLFKRHFINRACDIFVYLGHGIFLNSEAFNLNICHYF